jgi:hypothetical protein
MDIGTSSLGEPLQRARNEMICASMDGQDQVFQHHGPVGGELVQELLSLAERYSLSVGDPIGLRKRLFNVLVEGLENIHRHAGDEYNETAGAALFVSDAGYTMLLGNGMPVMKATMMEHRLDLLNLMDADDLKDHYMQLLANEGRTENGGAGLGLMTMARKSTRPMIFRSMAVDPYTVYGVLELRLAKQPK